MTSELTRERSPTPRQRETTQPTPGIPHSAPLSPKRSLPQDPGDAQSQNKRSRNGTLQSSTPSEPIDLCEDEDDEGELNVLSSYDVLMRDVHESAKNRFSIAYVNLSLHTH